MERYQRFMAVTSVVVITMLFLSVMPSRAAAEDGNLLYLVEFEATDAGAPTTRELTIVLLEKLIVPTLEKMADSSKILAGGLHVGARAGVFLVRAKSHDEVTLLVRELPAWGVMDWKVTPLESFTHRAGIEKMQVEMLRKQD